MTARWYHADVGGTFHEITDRVAREGWEIHEQAEEGEAGMSTVTFDDPDMDFDPDPWRNWYLLEDESEDANSMLCGGWVTEQEVGREGGEWAQPLGRVWSVGHTDANTYWAMRVMVGSDANRPAETDVERVQWLMGTNEMAWALDVTTYVSTANPIDMDACDYRGRMLSEIMSDCSQPPAGKNWYAWIDMIASVRTVTVWYGKDSLAVRDSALSLSNDPDDWTDATLEDGTSLVWPISMDTKLKRDPSRMYDGVYLTYDGGAVYRDTDPRTVRRDFISPNDLVKTQDKAIARAEGYLDELDEQDLVITTSVELPAAKATMIRAGMRVLFKATHLPEFDTAFGWCRVLSCAVTPIAAGERYRLTLELSPLEPLPQAAFDHRGQFNYATPDLPHETTPGRLLVLAIAHTGFSDDVRAATLYNTVTNEVDTDWNVGAAFVGAWFDEQYGGPGASVGAEIYWRRVREDETLTAPVLLQGATAVGVQSAWLWEIDTDTDPGDGYSFTTEPTHLVDGGTFTATTGLSGFTLGIFAIQEITYEYCTVLDPVHGTTLFDGQGNNVPWELVTGWHEPRTWIATHDNGGPFSATVTYDPSGTASVVTGYGIAGAMLELPGVTSLPAIPYPANQVG